VDVDAEVDLREAATRLGISERTVRRRLHRGELEGRQVPTPQGPAWRIRLDTLPPLTHGHDGVRADGADLAAALRIIGEQQTQLREQAQQLLQLAGQVGYVQAQLQQRDEQLKALTAPTEASTAAHAPESAQEGHQTASVAGVVSDDLATPAAAPRKAWWRFW